MAAVKAALYFQCPSSKLWDEDGNNSQESSLLLLFVIKLLEFVQTIVPSRILFPCVHWESSFFCFFCKSRFSPSPLRFQVLVLSPKRRHAFSIESKWQNSPRMQVKTARTDASITIFLLEGDSETRKHAYVGELRSREPMCDAQARVILNFPMSHRCKEVQKTSLWESHYSGRTLL